MEHENKDRGRVLPVISLSVAFISLAALVTVLLRRDAIVIGSGIRAWSSMRTACLAVLAVSVTASVALLARSLSRAKQEAVNGIPDPPEKKALDEDDRRKLYGELVDFGMKKWSGMAGIPTLRKQLDSMDEYQAEMGRLLEQTDYLKEKPAEIVQRVEDCMYINIRKLLNYMRIVQTKSPAVMTEKIRDCVLKNGDLLKKTDDFVVAVVDYVNGDVAPGEEQKTKDYVDSYMFVVLEAIELPETYLR